MSTTTSNHGSIEMNPINQQHRIDIANNQPPPPPLNRPIQDLLHEDFNTRCVPLYNALVTGKWEAAKLILDKRPDLVRFSITKRYETPLHIAVLGKSSQFVHHLIDLMTEEDLKLINEKDETALHLVARAGNSKIAEMLVSKNLSLTEILDRQERMPLYMAAKFRRHELVNYLYDKSEKMKGDFWTDKNRSSVLDQCVETCLFDVALKIVSDHPELARNRSLDLLRLLAQKPDEFLVTRPPVIRRLIKSIFAVCHLKLEFPHKESEAFRLLRRILKEIMIKPMTEIDDMMIRAEGPLFIAAAMGNTKFIIEVIRQYPHLALEVNYEGRSIFHVAVSYRNEGVFKLLYENDHVRDLIVPLEDDYGNNLLHLVGRGAMGDRLQNIQGMGIRLNPELQWYKAVESILPSHLHEKRNHEGLTASQLFIKEHRHAFDGEEKSIKETATQLMVVAALVATISFAAVFTLPGGYNQDTGIPIFLRKNLSKIFIIFDSLSFISSTTSILMIISILNSDYDGLDIMISAPKQLRLCLASVFFSIATVILTFLINLFLLYHTNSNWIPITISVSAVIPYLVFANRQYRLPSLRKKLW